ncbi:MAG: tetratricopeptide repeat protein, partial [Thermodesulfobacteriota bacterium]
AKEDIKIFCIGVGDIAGAPIPDKEGGFIKDSKGNIILSKVDEKGLEKIADLTSGLYVRSVAGDMDLDMIYKDKILGTMERKTLTSGKKKVWENRFQWFLFPALILFLIELFLSTTKRIKHRKNLLSITVFVFALTFCWFNNTAVVEAKSVSSSVKSGINAFNEQNYSQAKKHFIDAQLEDPENQKLYFNIGAAAYMNKEYDQAKTNFKHALESDDKNLRHDAGYNLANTHYRLGNLEDAIKEYENILKEFPEDTKAKENLEFVKKKKEEQKQQESKSDKNQKESKEEKENRDKDKEKSDKEQENDQKKNQNKDQNSNQKNSQDKERQKDREKQPNSQQDKQEKKQSSHSNQEKDKNMEKTDPKNRQQKQAARNMENMLNRLEDKPGKAMIPVLEKQYIEKDW